LKALGDSLLKNTGIAILFCAIFGVGGVAAKASWFIDARAYHVSAHGQTSCQDCHEYVAGKPLHPDPSDVNKVRGDFFSPEMCFSCHEEIQTDLKVGKHGRKKIRDPQKYTYCIRCHKPHRQSRIGESRIGTFKPGIPRREQCGACHAYRSKLPPMSRADEACMTCHRAVNPATAEGRKKIQWFCFHCHQEGNTPARRATGSLVALINPGAYKTTPHANQSCTSCHPDGAAFHHQDQTERDCLDCHARHDELVAHDAHPNVACETCHLQGVTPFRDPVSRRILWKVPWNPGKPLLVHRMGTNEARIDCTRCHKKGNMVGASAMVLPAKSVICMPCHAATFSLGDTASVIALLIFLAGMVMAMAYWFTGALRGRKDTDEKPEKQKSIFGKIMRVSGALVLDVLLQRRLYRRSEGRWLIHALIFYPFLFRFTWGMVGLLGSLCRPGSETVWILLDRNYWLTAFLFDLSGALLLLGVLVALLRGTLRRFTQLSVLPRQDPLALCLIGGIVIVGFVLESMRMAMTGPVGDGEYAFVGYWISTFFSNPAGLTVYYGYVWYVHAILAGAFIAYLPFSRLFHMILAPVVLLMDAAGKEDR
jgi:nitrate reductase gamma subunit